MQAAGFIQNLYFVCDPANLREGAWRQVLARRQEASLLLAKAWFGQLPEMVHEVGRVTLAAPSTIVADEVHAYFLPQLLRAYAEIDPGVRRVEVGPVA